MGITYLTAPQWLALKIVLTHALRPSADRTPSGPLRHPLPYDDKSPCQVYQYQSDDGCV